jgi:hypothetical protein
MKEEATSKVTRRDFLKDVGAGAIGTAMISAGVLNPHAVEGAQPPVPRGVIPNGINDTHKGQIRTLLEQILNDSDLIAAKVVHVNLRLNVSDSEQKLPVFIDWVGTPTARSILERQGLPPAQRGHRFGDSLRSTVYDAAVASPPQIIERDWCAPGLLAEKTAQSRLLGQRAGAMYQMFIGIKAEQDSQRRCVGLLTAGFQKKLEGTAKTAVEGKMKDWAGWTSTRKPLVDLIANTFTHGGPKIT